MKQNRRITELQDFTRLEQEAAVSTDSFIRLMKKYMDVQKKNAAIIKEFVDKIYIYKAEGIGSKKVQKIKILWNCIGEFMSPVKKKAAQPLLNDYADIFRDGKSLCGTAFSHWFFMFFV